MGNQLIEMMPIVGELFLSYFLSYFLSCMKLYEVNLTETKLTNFGNPCKRARLMEIEWNIIHRLD